jgi:transcriptional regulator with XRE-family HTH domain
MRSSKQSKQSKQKGSKNTFKATSKKGDRSMSSLGRANGKRKLVTVGVIIKNARIKQNKRAIEVADACGVTQECVFQWERRTYIIAKNIPKIAKALGISERRLKTANEIGKQMFQRGVLKRHFESYYKRHVDKGHARATA